MLGASNSAAMCSSSRMRVPENIKRASRNLPQLTVRAAQAVSTYDVVSHDRIVLTESGLKRLSERTS